MKSDELWEKILIETISNSIKSLVVICLSALGVVLVSIYNPLSKILVENVPQTILLFLLLSLLMLLVASTLYIISLRKKIKSGLKQALNVYWDKDLNTYCPSCKKLLSNYGFYQLGLKNHPGFKCVNCKEIITMSDGKEIFMSLAEAKEIAQNLFNK